mmetsp:Transcript_23181/g.33219  ORF Transcript_23181/g.33219 Transcript_23181/m.33219 type:complete len:116 (-) Transcript_23181:198-545(-)
MLESVDRKELTDEARASLILPWVLPPEELPIEALRRRWARIFSIWATTSAEERLEVPLTVEAADPNEPLRAWRLEIDCCNLSNCTEILDSVESIDPAAVEPAATEPCDEPRRCCC